MKPTTTLPHKPLVMSVDGYLHIDAWSIALIRDDVLVSTSGEIFEVDVAAVTLLLLQMRTMGAAPTLIMVQNAANAKQVAIVVDHIASITRHPDDPGFATVTMQVADESGAGMLSVSASDADAIVRRWCDVAGQRDVWRCCGP